MKQVFKNLKVNSKLTDIVCENGIITDIGNFDCDGIDFQGKKAYPGLIDIHTHGICGIDTMDVDFTELSKLYAKNGTTTVYPTTMTASYENILKVLTAPISDTGARIEGFHLEGPYINEKYIGAQNSDYVRKPDVAEFNGFENVKIVTLAPELDGSMEYIRQSGAVICLGHTAADYATGIMAANAGAKCITHTFNAMSPLKHREPALIGAAFDSNMYVQVICDGEHIHPSVIRMLYKMFGVDRMILISDSMRAANLPDGEYDLGGLNIIVKDKIARTEDGALAGSTACLLDCVKCAISFGIPETDAFKMASETPAKLMGLNRGSICIGAECDLIILDDKNDIDTVIINGKTI